MKISVIEFGSEGVKFSITADNTVETALLTACVDTETDILREDDNYDFILTLLVSN